ncbi:MAG: putative packaging ATPase [Yellowstone Lake virophage 6]|uniref:putative packaging ATPase n=1 Tax=Yellowstone Lake virophage 6 TaxID=1557034 RepID=UPI000535CE71|nr:MAG: putative packaging ATPase [Yellowstone Lake virophage 6]AIW01891.1 MAG: putative packaging ATPase [Yellowstone Lake virophage 6]
MSKILLNLEGNGETIAIIKKEKQKDATVFLGENSKFGTDDLILEGADERFQLVPNVSRERNCHAIFGQAGSGKSFWCCEYIKNWIKVHPKRQIYLFTTITSDIGCLKDIKKIKIVQLNNDFAHDDIPMEDLKQSLCLFDDIDNIRDKQLKKKLFQTLNDTLQVGRKFEIDVLITFHVATAGNDTKIILNECNSVSFNYKTFGNRALKYLLDAYLGLDKKQIERIKKLEGRMITVLKTYPKLVLSEKELYVLE